MARNAGNWSDGSAPLSSSRTTVFPLTSRTMIRKTSPLSNLYASGWKVDIIIRKNRTFSREEFARRVKVTLLDVPVHVASAEDTIVAKLEWSKRSGGSERQRRDIAGIIATIGQELDRTYVERWVHELELGDEWLAAQKTAISA